MVAKTQLPAPRQNGGARENAGRPKGIGNKSRLYPTLRGEPISLRQEFSTTPLRHLLEIINTPYEQYAPKPQKRIGESDDKFKRRKAKWALKRHAYELRQDAAAKTAAPFMHYRLASIELTGKEAEPQKRALDLDRLNDTEMDLLEKLMRKADLNAEITLSTHQYTTINKGDGEGNDR